MHKNIFKISTVAFLGLMTFGYAQDYSGKVGINTETPNATLEIKAFSTNGSKKEGLLIPRLGRQAIKSMGTAEKSLLVYVNGLTGTKDGTVSDVDSEGFYYFNGTKWVKLGNATSSTATAGISGATNGLAKSGNNVKLGGALVEATTINQAATHNFTISGGNNQPSTVRFITDSHQQHNKAVYVGIDKNLRKFAGSDAPTYKDDDYMIILTNNQIHGKLQLPSASANTGRIIYLINGTTQGLNFASATADTIPFNFSTLNVKSSCGFISDGTTWYPLGR